MRKPMDNVMRRPTSYLISIWPEYAADGTAIWRGVLVTSAGQRLHFSTLAQLNRWLNELAGWQEPRQSDEFSSQRLAHDE
jgi:hypothetical protein